MAGYLCFVALALLVASPPTFSAPCGGTTGESIKIGAFNIKVFGKSKGDKPEVMEVIRKIVNGYDVILVQEIRQKSEKIIDDLLHLLNEASPGKFAYEKSTRLGRTSSKEQYVYYYRTDRVEVIRDYQFDDSAADMFEREPYSIHVKVNGYTGKSATYGLIGLHAKPDSAVAEIEALNLVYNKAKTIFNEENMIILGDLNADCSYASEAALKGTDLFGDDNFYSVITNDADTTVSRTVCAYDRIVLAGGHLPHHIKAEAVDRFDVTYRLTQEMTEDVSDHFPVYVELFI